MADMAHGERAGGASLDIGEHAQLLVFFFARFERLAARFIALPPEDSSTRRALARALYSTYRDCVQLTNREIAEGFLLWAPAGRAGGSISNAQGRRGGAR
jgi:hypothetical protein